MYKRDHQEHELFFAVVIRVTVASFHIGLIGLYVVIEEHQTLLMTMSYSHQLKTAKAPANIKTTGSLVDVCSF